MDFLTRADDGPRHLSIISVGINPNKSDAKYSEVI
jgi:hypothetical protein